MIKPRSRSFFIIGSGFTKSVIPEAPLNGELLPQMLKAARADSAIRLMYDKYGKPNEDIEILLTRMDIDIRAQHCESPSLVDARVDINKNLASLFSRFRITLDNDQVRPDTDWLEPFATKVVAENDVFVSLNYDCLLEGILDRYKAWSPRGGYGPSLGATIEGLFRDSNMPANRNLKGVMILKPHGSVTFRESYSLGGDPLSHLEVEYNGTWFPESARHSHIGAINSHQYVVAPSFFKNFHFVMTEMMVDALRYVAEASNLIIIGCGLRQEDFFLRLLLTAFASSPVRRRVIVVDPNAGEIAGRLADHFQGYLPESMKICPLQGKFRESLQELTTRVCG